MTGAPGAILTYDVSNHVASANVNGAVEQYGYTPSNQRFYKRKSDGTEYITFYGAMGERLAEYKFGRSYPLPIYFKSYVWFGGRLIWEGPTTLYGQSGTSALMDRVGSNRAIGAKFMPYGEEVGTATANDRVKFGTYTRDSFTGLDYAVNRWYLPGQGRFGSADPYMASATSPSDPSTPLSWNRYAYVSHDPINTLDPAGTCGTPAIYYEKANGTIVASVSIPCDYQFLFVEDAFGRTGHKVLNDRATLGDDLPFLTSKQLKGYADVLRQQVENGLPDCTAMASYIDSAGAGRTAIQLAAAIGIFVPQDSKTVAAGIPASTSPIGFVSAKSGFLSQYQNTNGDSSDQSHHFAAFFLFGFQYGLNSAALLGNVYEGLEGFRDHLGFNQGDVNLAIAAGSLGFQLSKGNLRPDQVGTVIRDVICVP